MTIAVHQDVVAAVDHLCALSDNIFRRFPIPTTIFHYTPSASAIGIIQTNELWLSDAFNTNDQDEIRHGLRLLRRLLKTSDAFGEKEKRIRLLDHIFHSMQEAHMPRIFFTSFTGSRNNINSFCLYADETRGVMLGIDSGFLNKPATAYDTNGRTTRRCVLRPVIYDEIDKETLLSMQIDALGLFLTKLENAGRLTEGNRWYVVMKFLGHIYQSLACFKTSDWNAEQEVRLLVTLLTSTGKNEVAVDGLRRPFVRQHPRTKKPIEYLKCFIPQDTLQLPEFLDLRDNTSTLHHEKISIVDCMLGAANEDSSLPKVIRDGFPNLKLARSNARFIPHQA